MRATPESSSRPGDLRSCIATAFGSSVAIMGDKWHTWWLGRHLSGHTLSRGFLHFTKQGTYASLQHQSRRDVHAVTITSWGPPEGPARGVSPFSISFRQPHLELSHVEGFPHLIARLLTAGWVSSLPIASPASIAESPVGLRHVPTRVPRTGYNQCYTGKTHGVRNALTPRVQLMASLPTPLEVHGLTIFP